MSKLIVQPIATVERVNRFIDELSVSLLPVFTSHVIRTAIQMPPTDVYSYSDRSRRDLLTPRLEHDAVSGKGLLDFLAEMGDETPVLGITPFSVYNHDPYICYYTRQAGMCDPGKKTLCMSTYLAERDMSDPKTRRQRLVKVAMRMMGVMYGLQKHDNPVITEDKMVCPMSGETPTNEWPYFLDKKDVYYCAQCYDALKRAVTPEKAAGSRRMSEISQRPRTFTPGFQCDLRF